MSDDEDEQVVSVYDQGDHIELQLNSGMGWAFSLFLDDKDAEFLIDTIRNKLNSRWNKDG
jgi:hypothetical protein